MKNYVIIGAGVSGLYAAYSLHKYLKIHNIIIIEKSDRIGGRIFTKYLEQENMILEMGPSKIASNHYNVLKLLEELNLTNDLNDGSISTRSYIDYDITNNHPYVVYNSKKEVNINESFFYDIIDKFTQKLNEGDHDFCNLALNHTLYSLIEKFCGTNIANYMKHQFGYDKDFISQNAINGILMFNESFKKNIRFYGLKNGLIQIVNKLELYLKNNNIEIRFNTECVDITKDSDHYVCILNNKEISNSIITNNIIFGIPKVDLLKIKYFKPILPLLNNVIHKQLIRIYVFFPIINNNVWFNNIDNIITTNTPLRQIVPIDKDHGLLMIYCDGTTAKFWHHLCINCRLEDELLFNIRRLFNNIDIPDPIKIYVSYYDSATHMWKQGINSFSAYHKTIKPFDDDNIFIIGEAYSLTQQWMEGAVKTVNKMIEIIKTKN